MGLYRCDVAIALALTLAGLAPSAARAAEPADATRELAQLKSQYADVLALEGTAKREIFAIARILRQRPAMAIDLAEKTGEYCFNSGSGTMVHYASDPAKSREDIVYEFAAEPLIKAGLKADSLPKLPPLGQMQPGQWYYLAPGEIDPHHRMSMGGPMVLIAVDVK